MGRGTPLFLLYSAIFHIGFLGIADVVLNFYFVSLGYDADTIGWMQSLPRLAGFITSVPVSLLANRIGSRRMVALSNFGIVAALIVPVLLPSLPAVAFSRFLIGFLYGAHQIATAPLMIALVDSSAHTRFFAYHNVVSMGSGALGNFIGGWLPALLVGALAGVVPAELTANAQTPFAYGATLLIAALVTLASTIPFGLMRSVSAPVTVSQPFTAAQSRDSWGLLVVLMLPMLLFGFTGGLTFPFYNLFFRTQFSIPDDVVGTIISIGWLGMGLIPLLNPWWERRFGRVWALALTMLIAAAGFFWLSLAPSLVISVIAFTLAVSFRNVMQPLFQPLVLDSLPRHLHNNASGMSMVLWNIGWFSATASSGVLQRTLGFPVIMQIVAVGVLLTAALVLVIYRRPQRSLFEPAGD
jgi:MFS family permease